jgi:hypothetical protein
MADCWLEVTHPSYRARISDLTSPFHSKMPLVDDLQLNIPSLFWECFGIHKYAAWVEGVIRATGKISYHFI